MHLQNIQQNKPSYDLAVPGAKHYTLLITFGVYDTHPNETSHTRILCHGWLRNIVLSLEKHPKTWPEQKLLARFVVVKRKRNAKSKQQPVQPDQFRWTPPRNGVKKVQTL